MTTKDFTYEFQKHDDKAELLRELESPEKSFTTPLFRPIPKAIEKQEPIILPDHQLQNTHIETPYIEEQPQIPVITAITAKPVDRTIPTIKKPTLLTLSIDPYKESID